MKFIWKSDRAPLDIRRLYGRYLAFYNYYISSAAITVGQSLSETENILLWNEIGTYERLDELKLFEKSSRTFTCLVCILQNGEITNIFPLLRSKRLYLASLESYVTATYLHQL